LDGIWLIGEKNAEAVAGIRPHLQSEDPRIRVVANLALIVADPTSKVGVLDNIGQIKRIATRDKWSERWAEVLHDRIRTYPPQPEYEIDLQRLGSDSPAWREAALDYLRSLPTKFRDREPAFRKLLDSETPAIVRDAAIGLELIGADPRPALIEAGKWNALLFCRPVAEGQNRSTVEAGEDVESFAALRDWAIAVGRAGSGAVQAEGQLRELSTHDDEELRAAAVWALGRIGKASVGALVDRSAAVRAITAQFVKTGARLASIEKGREREAAALAIRKLEDPSAALRSPDPLLRIAAVRALGDRVPEAIAGDPDRDVRIAVAQQKAIGRQLADSNWRVRLDSIRSHGRTRKGAKLLAPFLSDRNLALSAAAADALRKFGAPAALPVARLLDPGNEAVWEYAPEIFEALGESGSAAAPILVSALRHTNSTAREAAARCLGAIGAKAKPASPALIDALKDPHLPVVSHAALALGRIGLTDALRAALTSDRPRVRAYSAFAIGWALGAARKIDQVAYEPRLPLLDCGVADPGVTLEQVAMLPKLSIPEGARLARRGIWAKDPRIANPCAAFLEHDQMSPLECERSIELAVADGFRRGHPFDFERFRSTLGCNELPGCLEYVMYARETDPPRPSLFGDLHRAPRSSNIPALCWFARNEDSIRLEDLGCLYQPFDRTNDYRKELTRWWLGREGSVWDVIEYEGAISRPARWWLESEVIPEDREALLVEIAWRHRRVPKERADWKDVERIAALRALSRGHGVESELYLRRTALLDGDVGLVAQAALARRGDPLALVRLVRAAAKSDEALSLLIEMRPDVAGPVLRDRLSDPATATATAELVRQGWRHSGYMLGTQWIDWAFLGLESSLDPGLLDAGSLATIALHVPGCRTRRLADALLDRLRSDPPAELELDVAGLLFGASKERFVALLRAWARSKDPALQSLAYPCLLRLGDPADAGFVRTRIGEGFDGCTGDGWRFGLAAWIEEAQEAWLRASPEEDQEGLAALQAGFYIGGGVTPEEQARIDEAALQGRGATALRSLLERRVDLLWMGEDPRRRKGWGWMPVELARRYDAREFGGADEILGRLATWPVPGARADYWSALRAGRYRWVVWSEYEYGFTLGYDLLTLPHWRRELESNCCKVSGRLEGTFEDLFDIHVLYSCHSSGIGEPPSERLLDWFELLGGDMEWSPMARRFLPKPE
ncbi:MAG: HEAT repeat domain-containing protein, partial [Planctomycetota bacterium]